ncbi:hypothetical protein AURDEDRAFT_184137 [Auricularia subglabra TFB-10046 SS5]|nr:hypothetical protein AURDEDRAFT_184137 [Auricularia subglabra TFB-10046 SS5]
MSGHVLDYWTFKALFMPHVLAALHPAGETVDWSATGVQNLKQLAGNMHDWVSLLVRELGRMANARCPVNRLPKEVLCMIFSEVWDPDDFYNEALLDLGDVCRYWNEIVRGTPSFWTRFTYRDADGDNLAWRLRHTQYRPIDVALFLRDDARSAGDAEVLLHHMPHVRALELDATAHVLAGYDCAAATAVLDSPAPILEKLAIRTPQVRAASGIYVYPAYGAFLPQNLFSGHASALRDLLLNNVSLPVPTWPPLRALQRFSYWARAIDAVHLAAVLQSCPGLRHLSVRSTMLRMPPQWPSQFSGSFITPSRSHMTVNMRISPPSDITHILGFLKLVKRDDPKELFCSVGDEAVMGTWLLRAMHASHSIALHLTDCDASRSAGVAAQATAVNAAGDMRSTWIEIPSLLAFYSSDPTSTFGGLQELTIAEMLWPESGFPQLPQLQTLTIALVHPQHTEDDSAAILLLPVNHSETHAWPLPALRTLNLAYAERDAKEDYPHGPPWGTPLVVSAADVALFITWNIRTYLPVKLTLQNVLLFERAGTLPRLHLQTVVQQLLFEDAYVPTACDTTDPFTAMRI